MERHNNQLKQHGPVSEAQTLEATLQQYQLFQGVDAAQLARLTPIIMLKQFRDEEIVCHCPDVFHDAFVLVKGTVGVTREKEGFRHTVQLEKTGAVFNVGPLVGRDPEQAGVRALGVVEILAMDNRMLRQLIESDEKLGFRFIRSICRLVMDQYERQIERLLG